MADDKREPPGLPGSEIVGQFGEEIRATITAAVKSTTADTRRSFARWSAATIVGSAVVAGAAAWFVNPPSHAPAEWLIHHADGLVETCVLAPEGDRATFVCRLPR